MHAELSLVVLIFVFLVLQVAGTINKTENWLLLGNMLLLINVFIPLLFSCDIQLFDGMFYTNKLISFEKLFLNAGTWLIVLLAAPWLKNHKHVPEFYILLISVLLGMHLMISSGNMLMFYLGLELSSIPLAVLVNFDLEKRRSSEAAMKMIFASAFATAFLLFGVSWLYGLTGSLQFSEVVKLLPKNEISSLALFFLLAGFAFKLSVVPFHFWTADVYEGAPASITAFLALISKASMLFVLLNPGIGLFASLGEAWTYFLMIIIFITLIIGNLFALRQNNVKRFLAFSSIAQMAYLLLGLLPNDKSGQVYVLYFLPIYLFSSLLLFAIVSVLSHQYGKEDIEDYKGFYKNNKFASWVLAIGFFSLAGVPPTAGFFGKLFLMTGAASSSHYVLLLIAALNMVISLYYYLRFVKAIFMDKNAFPQEKITISMPVKGVIAISLVFVFGLGFYGPLPELIQKLLNGWH